MRTVGDASPYILSCFYKQSVCDCCKTDLTYFNKCNYQHMQRIKPHTEIFYML